MYADAIELYVIRHAESQMNTLPIFSGRSNETPLTERGVQQARRLGMQFASAGIMPTAVHVSPAVRTMQSAQHCLAALGTAIQPAVEDALQELDQGNWVGQRCDAVLTESTLAEMHRLGKHFKEGGGESMHEVSQRILRWLDDTFINANIGPRRVFIFTHGAAISSVASHLDNWPYEKARTLRPDNASVTLLTHRGQGWQMEYFGQLPTAPKLQPTVAPAMSA